MERDELMKNNNKKGFTLVELSVVICIVGILSCLLVPNLISFIKKAKIAAAIADTKTIKTSIESSLTDHLVINYGESTAAFNKVLYLEQGNNKTENTR